MKTKLFTLALVAVAIMATSCGTSRNATLSQNVNKSAKNYIAEQIEEWEADGYKRSGPSVTYSLEELMIKHRSKMEAAPNKYFELYGVASKGGKSSLSALKLMVINDVAREYATKADMSMKGKMGSHFNSLSEDVKDIITASYISEISSNIIPYLKESFAIEKITPTSMELRIYYIVDEEQAAKVRAQAANTAAKKAMDSITFGQNALKDIEQAATGNPLSE